MARLTIHIKTTAGGLTGNKPVILLAYDNGDNWGAYRRMLDHRKVEIQYAASREVDQEEFDECSHKYRIGFTVYDDWQKLIDDERKFNVSDEWIAKLQELSAKYKIFNKQETLKLN